MGPDAIGGVIPTGKTKKNFQGLSFSGTYDKPQHPGGSSDQLEATFGHGDLAGDGYNILVSLGYSRQMELQASARSFSADGFDPARGDSATNNPGDVAGAYIDADGNFWQPGFAVCLCGQSGCLTTLFQAFLRLPVFRRDESAPGPQKEYSRVGDLSPSRWEPTTACSCCTSGPKPTWSVGPVDILFLRAGPGQPHTPAAPRGPSLASLVCEFPPAVPRRRMPPPAAELRSWSDPRTTATRAATNTRRAGGGVDVQGHQRFRLGLPGGVSQLWPEQERQPQCREAIPTRRCSRRVASSAI